MILPHLGYTLAYSTAFSSPAEWHRVLLPFGSRAHLDLTGMMDLENDGSTGQHPGTSGNDDPHRAIAPRASGTGKAKAAGRCSTPAASSLDLDSSSRVAGRGRLLLLVEETAVCARIRKWRGRQPQGTRRECRCFAGGCC